MQVVSATGEYDPSIKGFIITFMIEEGGGSLRNYDRSHHQHQPETLDGHALKSNRREECVLMPAKMSRSVPRPPFRLREVSIAVRTLRLPCRKAGKAPIFTPVRESIWGIPV